MIKLDVIKGTLLVKEDEAFPTDRRFLEFRDNWTKCPVKTVFEVISLSQRSPQGVPIMTLEASGRTVVLPLSWANTEHFGLYDTRGYENLFLAPKLPETLFRKAGD